MTRSWRITSATRKFGTSMSPFSMEVFADADLDLHCRSFARTHDRQTESNLLGNVPEPRHSLWANRDARERPTVWPRRSGLAGTPSAQADARAGGRSVCHQRTPCVHVETIPRAIDERQRAPRDIPQRDPISRCHEGASVSVDIVCRHIGSPRSAAPLRPPRARRVDQLASSSSVS
jgi:hypothetical protein